MQKINNKTFNKLFNLLSGDLNFHDDKTNSALHNFHSFPAKFPSQLPNKFIISLTKRGDSVLDPMMGSGTTVLEACLCDRRGIGCDIDPLSILINQVKVGNINIDAIEKAGIRLLNNAQKVLNHKGNQLLKEFKDKLDIKTHNFIDYWFAPESQAELISIISEINRIDDVFIKNFFKVVFSSIIITKSGGVSLSFDLAHTRPHRSKIAISKNGNILFGKELINSPSPRIKLLTKKLRSALTDFEKRFQKNLNSLTIGKSISFAPEIKYCDAKNLDIPDSSIDLIITSPPYASNAIDYMRAHKFSLVWFGYPIDELSQMRSKYIGGESLQDMILEEMPGYVSNIISNISKIDAKKSLTLHRYYSEIKQTLKEMFRVLKPNKSAIVVVGNSIMRNVDTEIGKCIAEIGKKIGFIVPKIGIRDLDRNKRMLPTGNQVNLKSQIQQRMHQEYVIGLYKPMN